MPERVPASRNWLRHIDGRLKMLLLMAACFITQYLPDLWLIAWLVILGGLFLPRTMRMAETRAIVRGGLIFTFFWLAMKAGSDLFEGAAPTAALTAALPLAGRLVALTLVGAAYVGLSSPVEIAKAAAWFLRPILGRRAWKPALAVALTAWFLPRIVRLAGEVSAAMRARGLTLPWRTKAVLLVGTSLRILFGQADELAVGLASRRLDDYRSWNMDGRDGRAA